MNNDFTTSFVVDQTPEKVFDAINNPSGASGRGGGGASNGRADSEAAYATWYATLNDLERPRARRNV